MMTMDIDEIMLGDMGIQAVYKGEEMLYSREKSYCYIELECED